MKKQTKHLLLLITYILYFFPEVSYAIDHNIHTIPNVRQTDGNKYVSNPDKIISSLDEYEINQILKKLEKEKTIEVAVVAVKSIGNYDSQQFAKDLFAHWKIGKSEDDNGLLIFLVTEPSQRSVVFETGYGLEEFLTDDLCYQLQQDFMIPYLKDGEYSTGMRSGVSAVSSFLMESDYEAVAPKKDSNILIDALVILFFPVLIIIMAIWAITRKYRKQTCPGCQNKTYKYVRTVTTQQATYNSKGLKHIIYMCSSCGRTDTIPVSLARYRRSSRNYRNSYRSSSSSSYRAPRSNKSSTKSSSSGRSYGGGRSGGSGARSKF